MGSLLSELRKYGIVENICRKKPCLWVAKVSEIGTKVKIYLGKRYERPLISFKFKNGSYECIFLTTFHLAKGKKIPLHLCPGKRNSFHWKEEARIFRRDGKVIFRIPEKILKKASFHSTCKEEIVKIIERAIKWR
ncbi:MAG: hypothetical protein ABGX27_09295 [Desulfurobacteriaceae bacterium]